MNDFTKEELELIKEGLLWRDNHISPQHTPVKLHCKIQSMIDNYCEHEKSKADLNYEVERCLKCEKLII